MMFLHRNNRSNPANAGFTLIELLVVIAIIGLLASIILASLNSARQKGRDARRVADMKEMQLALELYYDANSAYPTQASALVTAPTSSGTLPTALAPTYISTMPIDPTSSGGYFYQYQSLNSDGSICNGSPACQGYLIVAQLESSSNNTTWTGTITGDPAGLCPVSVPSSAPFPYCVHS